jgi:hypothetical protein
MDWANFPTYERFRNRLGCNVSVIGDGHDEVLPTYTMPLPPEGTSEEEMPILYPICPSGPNKTFAKPETFFELSIAPVPSFKRGQAYDHF